MSKYDFEFKQKIVQEYLNGEGGYFYLTLTVLLFCTLWYAFMPFSAILRNGIKKPIKQQKTQKTSRFPGIIGGDS